MKIAILLDNSFTDKLPYPKRVCYQIESLIKCGYDITVFCKMEKELNLPKEEYREGIKIKRCFPYFLGTTTLIDKYLKANIDLYNNINEKFDVYHCVDTNTWPIGYILSQRDNAKFICETYEYFPDYICEEWHLNDLFKYDFTKLLVKARGDYIKYADKVITVSEPISNKLMEKFSLKEKPAVIYNTRPLAEVNKYKLNDNNLNDNSLRTKYLIDKDTKILLFQGIIEESRGIDIIIKCMKFVENTVAIIAGGDRNAYIEELKKNVIKNDVKNKIIFTGFMPSNELFKYTLQADVLIYLGKPLVENMELTIPNKFFDYIFACKPIIVSDLYALKEIVDKYAIGITIDIHNIDIEKIGNEVNELINSNKLIDAYTKNILKVKTLFSWEDQENKLFKLYKDLE